MVMTMSDKSRAEGQAESKAVSYRCRKIPRSPPKNLFEFTMQLMDDLWQHGYGKRGKFYSFSDSRYVMLHVAGPKIITPEHDLHGTPFGSDRNSAVDATLAREDTAGFAVFSDSLMEYLARTGRFEKEGERGTYKRGERSFDIFFVPSW